MVLVLLVVPVVLYGGEVIIYMKPIKPLYVIILLIVFAGAAFYGGMQYQKSQTRSSFGNGQF